MDMYIDIIYEMISFFLVVIIFMLGLGIYFYITLKNYKFDNKKTHFYGLFFDMDNQSILSFSLISISYLFLVSLATNFVKINVYYFIIILTMLILSNIIMKNYKKIFYSVFFTGISSLALVVINLLYKYLVNEYATIFLIIILGLLVLFVFMFFTYNLFKMLNDVLITNKNINYDKYKNI